MASTDANATSPAADRPPAPADDRPPADDDYRESDDDDFDPDAPSDASGSDASDDDEPPRKRRRDSASASGDEHTVASASTRVVAGDPDRILTRAQRAAGEGAKRPKAHGRATIDADALFASMRADSAVRPAAAAADDYVTIKRTYEFAKQLVTEEKRVPRDSAEAREYLAAQAQGGAASVSGNTSPSGHASAQASAQASAASGSATATASATASAPRGPPRRKKSSLDALAAKGKPTKLNTLEKSKMDWDSFVRQEGIGDDLNKFNKDGYLHKQDFLSRVAERRDRDYKDAQKRM
ncbi:bucentaur or craniofacial development-domain-containing protein [Dipodascopsis tothii]|uniref:bucentaur or craniofacial development-domain-containing protein n=1 Tax=Dipodascopsis tothii TaxID=44089 RepID=UPI0034CD9C54